MTFQKLEEKKHTSCDKVLNILTTASRSMVALICSDPGVTVNNDLHKQQDTV